MVLGPLLGSVEAEKALAFIVARGSGYASGIAGFYDTSLRGIQKQQSDGEMRRWVVAEGHIDKFEDYFREIRD